LTQIENAHLNTKGLDSMKKTASDDRQDEIEALFIAAKLMLISARTAPKTSGKDDILTRIITGEQKDQIAQKMMAIGRKRKIPGFKRDAQNVKDSQAILLIGVTGTKSLRLDCGACGYATCEEFEKAHKRLGNDFTGPNCLFKLLDLGIAIGSTAKTASTLNVDNRIMYRVGAAAKMLTLLPEATVIMGIPLSAKGKSLYFDR
jgi:uncharacterized ferredoxin-like protein